MQCFLPVIREDIPRPKYLYFNLGRMQTYCMSFRSFPPYIFLFHPSHMVIWLISWGFEHVDVQQCRQDWHEAGAEFGELSDLHTMVPGPGNGDIVVLESVLQKKSSGRSFKSSHGDPCEDECAYVFKDAPVGAAFPFTLSLMNTIERGLMDRDPMDCARSFLELDE
jgi:hypothetical protein